MGVNSEIKLAALARNYVGFKTYLHSDSGRRLASIIKIKGSAQVVEWMVS